MARKSSGPFSAPPTSPQGMNNVTPSRQSTTQGVRDKPKPEQGAGPFRDVKPKGPAYEGKD
jgi:hypothetical protein